jgi:hypothetical protein
MLHGCAARCVIASLWLLPMLHQGAPPPDPRNIGVQHRRDLHVCRARVEM